MRALVISGMALIAATYGLARFGFGLFLPRFTDAFQIGPSVSGLIQSGSFLSFCLAAVMAARIAARPRLVVACAGTTATLGSMGIASAPSAIILAPSTILAGAGAGFATPGLVALVERNIPRQRRDSAGTIVNAGTGAGIVAAGILLLLTSSQWRLGWLAIAALASLATIATLRSDRAADEPPDPPQRASILAPLRLALVAAGLAGASSAAIWTFGRTVMVDSRTEGETYSIIAWMVLGAFGVLGAIAGRLAHAMSLRAAWMLTASAMAASAIVLAAAPAAPLASYASVAVFGATYTAVCGLLIVWASRVVPGHAAQGTAALFIALATAQAFGAALIGVILGSTSPLVAFGIAAAVGFLAVLPATRRATESPATSHHGFS
ncbi:YbfB/YjiJ family MFS transporter [Hoyosella sp. G463]|uniref:YbfB/YjiJ family MFS transporter n=1 Tax=Lolliginicoccus lacisalsi TaxID=2742202 RepID=A0A927J9C0_9ACTN|nr:MFS transporter [Lolliginicoccus lacisalsi]MBD8504959.1 YbfB/YjiJ family MFS transporter [Lolliginicoccus lacisalsi]